MIGILKAYTTRVGSGQFPTELFDEHGEYAAPRRDAKSARPRDDPAGAAGSTRSSTRYATRVNGINDLAVTKLDVLDNVAKIRVCVGYKVGRKVYETVPSDVDELQRCAPIYQEFDGWLSPTKHVTDFDSLPKRARVYLQKLAQLSGAKLSIVSVGARREETIFL